MKVAVNYDRCEGHGLCAEQAPAVFSLDEEGELIYRYQGQDTPNGLAPVARAAIASCPVAALRELSLADRLGARRQAPRLSGADPAPTTTV